MANGTHSQKLPDGAYATAMELLEAGEAPAAVEQKLLALGVSVDAAKQVIADHQRATAQVNTVDQRTDMKWGPILIALGVLVLIVSGPTSPTGWFGIVVGAGRFGYAWYKQRAERAAQGGER